MPGNCKLVQLKAEHRDLGDKASGGVFAEPPTKRYTPGEEELYPRRSTKDI